MCFFPVALCVNSPILAAKGAAVRMAASRSLQPRSKLASPLVFLLAFSLRTERITLMMYSLLSGSLGKRKRGRGAADEEAWAHSVIDTWFSESKWRLRGLLPEFQCVPREKYSTDIHSVWFQFLSALWDFPSWWQASFPPPCKLREMSQCRALTREGGWGGGLVCSTTCIFSFISEFNSFCVHMSDIDPQVGLSALQLSKCVRF